MTERALQPLSGTVGKPMTIRSWGDWLLDNRTAAGAVHALGTVAETKQSP